MQQTILTMSPISVSKLCCPTCHHFFEMLRIKKSDFVIHRHHDILYQVELPPWLPTEKIAIMLSTIQHIFVSQLVKLMTPHQGGDTSGTFPWRVKMSLIMFLPMTVSIAMVRTRKTRVVIWALCGFLVVVYCYDFDLLLALKLWKGILWCMILYLFTRFVWTMLYYIPSKIKVMDL
jgi:hypothetical protein